MSMLVKNFHALVLIVMFILVKWNFLSFRIRELNLFVASAYIPPNLKASEISKIRDFFIEMIDCEFLRHPYSNLLICGDFNRFDSSFFSEQFSLYNCVKSPTRKDAVLDHIWLNTDFAERYHFDACIGPPIMSCDHNTVFLYGKCGDTSYKNLVKVWDFRRSNIDKFLRIVSNVDFSDIVNAPSVNDMCEQFYSCLYSAASFIPTSYVTFTCNDKPWVTPVLKHLINLRWRAYRTQNWGLFVHYKKKVRDEIDKAKRLWVQRNTNTSKNLWKVVNEVRGKELSGDYDALINNERGLQYFLIKLQCELSKHFNNSTNVDSDFYQDEPWHVHSA